MSKYTTEVRYICENYAGLDESAGYEAVDRVVSAARDKIFDFDYPIFDTEYKSVLETKILKHFYTREIGAETVGLWKLWLNTKMNEIMPYYNQLYKSALIDFNPLYDVDLTTKYQKVDNGSNSKTGGSTESDIRNGAGANIGNVSSTSAVQRTDGNKNDHWEMFSNTPEGGVDGVRAENYLTTVLHTTDDKTGSTSGEQRNDNNDTRNESSFTESGSGNKSFNESGTLTNVEDYAQHVSGKNGGVSYSKMLKEFRETFLNIDMKVINELSDLFMTLW